MNKVTAAHLLLRLQLEESVVFKSTKRQRKLEVVLRHDPHNQRNRRGAPQRAGYRLHGVTVSPGAGVRQEALGAWWQGPGLGGAALTGPRGPSAAGPYGEQ